MANYQELPPQNDPKQPTAKHRPDSLGEHLQAFLNANNLSGFATDVPDDTETVAGVFMSVINEPYLNITQVREVANKLKRLTNKMIPYNRSLFLISRLYGYESWKEAKDAGGGEGIVNRLRDPKKSLDILNDSEYGVVAKGRRRMRDAQDIALMIRQLESNDSLPDNPDRVLDHYDPDLWNHAALLGELNYVAHTLVLASMSELSHGRMISALKQQGVDIHFIVKTKGYIQTRKGRVLFGQSNTHTPLK